MRAPTKQALYAEIERLRALPPVIVREVCTKPSAWLIPPLVTAAALTGGLIVWAL